MKKLILLFSFYLLPALFLAGNFRITNSTTTSQSISNTPIGLYHFNILDLSSTDTIYVKLYDQITPATSADTPVMTLQCLPLLEIWWYVLNTQAQPYMHNFTKGCQVRTVKGVLDNNNTSPSISPIIEGAF